MDTIQWLLEGDPSIIKMTHKYLLGTSVQVDWTDSWYEKYMDEIGEDFIWGRSFYNPKWACSHYTLLELRNLEVPKEPRILKSIQYILDHHKISDGGVNPNVKAAIGDVCINGMFLNYAAYFQMPQESLTSIVDMILALQVQDGGYNCQLTRSGCHHSSVHSTICVLEGLETFLRAGYTYRVDDIRRQQGEAEEFLLRHKLYKSDHTDQVIHASFLVFAYPSRYKYNILRALLYFAGKDHPYDQRMKDALLYLLSKRNKYGTWNMPARHQGKDFFLMEKGGQASRLVTLQAERVIKHYGAFLEA